MTRRGNAHRADRSTPGAAVRWREAVITIHRIRPGCGVPRKNIRRLGAENTQACAAYNGCPTATGRLSGDTLGLVKLGMTRAQVVNKYARRSARGTRD
jgi:hypothetical protein